MKAILFLLLCLCPALASAQWVETASGLTGSLYQTDGAMTYCEGVVWVGTNGVWSSTDSGATWTQASLSPVGIVAHIFFLDRNNGLITTHSGYVYRTRDGGASWSLLLSIGSATSACFLNDTNNILVSEFQPGDVHFSRDGGLTWRTVPIDDWVREIVPATNGNAFLLSGDWSADGHVWKSTNHGATWAKMPGQVDADSYSFDLDPCNSNNIIDVNEEYSVTADYDGVSELFVSSNGGTSWNVTFSHPSKYFAGSVTMGPHTIFCQTVSEANGGVERSTDGGQKWQNIGGPSSTGDTRLITSIDDNHLVAADINGSIWVTSNSGGDSITLPQINPSAISSLVVPSSSTNVTASSCESVDTTIPIGIISCGPPNGKLDSAWLTGSLAFSLGGDGTFPRTLGTVDSIPINYAPSLGSADTSWLHLRYDLGSGAHDTSILLAGTASALATNPQFLHREATSAYYGQVDSLAMAVDLSSTINLDSLWPFLTDIQGTFAFDSSVVSFASYNPPQGWTLTSLTNHGNSVDFAIHKISAQAGKPLVLGTALFLPNSDQLATSWVTLPRFVMEVGGNEITLCVTQNEDSHWSVKTRGVLSGVKLPEAPPLAHDVSVYPNPARNECFIDNPNSGPAVIAIFDVTGRCVATQTIPANSTAPLHIESLASGPYILVDKEGGHVTTHQISKMR